MIGSELEKRLVDAVYSDLRYRLRLREAVELPPFALLRLRREFSAVVRDLADSDARACFRTLLQPPLPQDPVVLRRVQQPAPGFVLRCGSPALRTLAAGDELEFDVCFFGRGTQLTESFSRLLDGLGEIGLYAGRGRFAVESIENRYAPSAEPPLWGRGPYRFAPRLHDLAGVAGGDAPTSVRFEWLTPARLLKARRPMFRPNFADIFPFILRRVSGMLAVWAELEDIFAVSELLSCAAALQESNNRLGWRDWRPLRAGEEAGGVDGSVVVEGEGLERLWPLLRIGELFGVGKGAAFGAGSYRLVG